MKLDKYMSIYRNDALTINDEEVIGALKDIKEYFRYELASQCMTHDFDYENFIDNAKMIIYFLEDIEESGLDDNIKTRAFIHPMGAICIDREYKEVE